MQVELLWIISYIILYFSVFWLIIFFENRRKMEEIPKSNYLPYVSIVIPAHNEEEVIENTIKSSLNLDYPKDRYEIIVVNDGSTDRTAEIVRKYIGTGKVKLINQKKSGKGSAVNKGISESKGELIVVQDADTVVEKDTLKKLVPFFEDEKVGAVVSTIKPINKNGLMEKMQLIEYLFAIFFRRLMSFANTLFLTPGAFSIYRKSALEKVGPFDENNLTEDLEMGFRLRKNGYKILSSINACSYTKVPSGIYRLYRQRIRWNRGMIKNTLKYRDMVFNRNYGYLGMFQMPYNIIAPTIAVIGLILFLFGTYNTLEDIYIQLTTIGLQYKFELKPLEEYLLNINIKGYYPAFTLFSGALIILYLSQKYSKERLNRNIFEILLFFVIYWIVQSFFWILSIIQELFRMEERW